MANVLLTFVVPCYNVEYYVQRCLDSIFSCGLPDTEYEVLCINDCSPDRTIDILNLNQDLHQNLHIISHKTNKGLGAARNTGISLAKGKYIWFVDSDDEVTCEGFPSALKTAIKDNLDVLCFNYCRIDDEGKELSRHIVFNSLPKLDGYTFVNQVFQEGIVFHMGYVVRFIYRTEYLRSHELFFPEGVYWEDTVYMPKSLLEAEHIASIHNVFYRYRVNPNSATNTFKHAYPARLIYEYAFKAGRDLLSFSFTINDEKLKKAIQQTAIKKYINGFPIHLYRTCRNERKAFFAMVSIHRKELVPLKNYLFFFNRLLLWPVLGSVLSEGITAVYRLKHLSY